MSASSEVFEKYGITTNETSIPRVEGMSASDAVMAKYGIDTSSRDRRRQLREEDDKRREEERKKEEEERRVDQERRDTWMKGYEKEPEGDKPGQAESLINEYMSTVAGGISSAGSSIESTGKVWQMGDTEEEETGEKNVFKERRDKVKDVYTNVAEFFARKIHGDEGFEQKKKEFGEVLEEYGSAIKTTYGEGKIDELELLKGIREDIIAKEDRGVVSDVAHTLAGGIGSMTAGLGASALGGVVGGPTGAFMAGSATMGLQEKGSFVEEAKTALARQRGVEVKDLSDADILNADTGGNIYGAVSGVLESLVPAKSIGRILKGKGEKSLIGAIVKSMALTGLEEGTTEYSQRMAQNIILKVRELDPEIKITEGAWEEAVAGAITGAFTFGLGSGIATGIRKPDDVARELLSDGDTKSAEKEMDGMSIQEMRELKTDMDNMNDSMSSEVVMGKLESRAKEVDTQTKRVIKENNLSVLAESTPQVKADVINNIKEIAPFNEEAQVVLGKIESRENKQAEIETQIESKKKLIGEGGINKKVLEESTEKLVTRLNKSQDLSVYEINDVLEGGNIEDIKELPAETQKTFNREIAKIAETEGPNQETAKNIISKLEMEKEVKFQEKLPEHPLTTSETDLSPTQIKAYKKAEELLVISEQAVDPKIQQASLSEANQIMADNDIKVSTAGFKDKYGIDTKFQEKETPLQQEIKKAKKEGKTAEEFVRQDFQDKVTAGQELGDEINKKVNTDGTITLYHGTSKQALEKISEGGEFNDGAYFSVEKTGTEYGDSPIDVAKRKFGEDGVVMEIKVDARDLESTAGNSEVFSPNKLIKQPDGSWKSEIVKTEKQLINEYNKTEDKFQEKAGEKRITTKEAFKRIAESPLLKGLNIKKVGAIFTPQGAEAWGKYSQGWIEFAENPKDTTLSHESFHAFLDLLVPDSKVQEAFKEIRKRDKKDYTDLQAEEILAEEFAEFFISEKRPTNKLEQFFAYLSRKLKNMINGADVIETLFNEATNPANTAKIKKALRDDRKTKLAGAFQEKEKADITTPAFKKWFGGSKVVDENGDPLIVYHGSSQTFNIFKPSQPSYETEPSMYFTDNLQIADTYYSKYEGKVYNVYLKMENPYVINASGQTYNDFYDEATRAINDAKKDGYDGVRIDDIIDDNQQHGDDFPSATTFVVFNPNQIKSVENIGTFSPTDPDIRYQTKEVTKKGKEVANLTKDLNSVNDSRRALRQDFIQSADGQELIMRHDASQEFVQDIDPQILQGIRNNPIYKKEGSITDEMADGYLMEKNGRYVVSGRTGTQALEMSGYNTVVEVDTLAQEAGFDNSLEFLEDQVQYINQNTLTQEINEELMKRSEKGALEDDTKQGDVREYDYATLTTKAQDIHRERRKLYKDQESFEVGQQAMKNLKNEVISNIKKEQKQKEDKQKAKFREEIKSLADRRKMVKTIQGEFGLSESQMKRAKIQDDGKVVNREPNIQAMSDKEFDQYLDELYVKAGIENELEAKRQEAEFLIWNKELGRVDALRKSMKLPKMEEMNSEELNKFVDVLNEAEKYDIYLTQRQLETMKNTEVKDAKTLREIREAYDIGDDVIDFSKLKMARVLSDTVLARKHPIFKTWIDLWNRNSMDSDKAYLSTEKKTVELMKKARKSRKNSWKDLFSKEDTLVFQYLESENKSEVAKKMTPEELEASKYMETEFARMRDYLIANEFLTEGYVKNYMMHTRKTFFEKMRSSGFVGAIKETFEKNDEEEATFSIVSDIGEILPLEKFASMLLHRGKDSLDYSENAQRVFLEYNRTFNTKKALDATMPVLDAIVLGATPTMTTEKGLVMDRKLKTFYNEWMNNKKGRKFTFGGALAQGGKIDRSLRFMQAYTGMKYLGGNIATQIASFGGEQAMSYVGLGMKKYAKGTARLNTKQGKKIVEDYRNFIGKSIADEFKSQDTILGKMDVVMFGGFSASSLLANKQFLLGSLTKEEFESGEVSSKRLSALKVDLGRWRVTDGAKSIIGSTAIVSTGLQFKTWAVPIIQTLSSNMIAITTDTKNKVKDKVTGSESKMVSTKQQRAEMARALSTIGVAFLFGMALSDEDNPILNKLSRDLYTVLGAVDPEMWLSIPNPPSVGEISAMYQILVEFATQVKYTTNKEDQYSVGDLKAIRHLQQQLPKGLTQFSEY